MNAFQNLTAKVQNFSGLQLQVYLILHNNTFNFDFLRW